MLSIEEMQQKSEEKERKETPERIAFLKSEIRQAIAFQYICVDASEQIVALEELIGELKKKNVEH